MPQFLQLVYDLANNVDTTPFGIDLSANLASGETLASSPAPVVTSQVRPGTPGSPAALTISNITISSDGKQVVFNISGGTIGCQYDLSCRAYTTLGRYKVGDVAQLTVVQRT